jgi:hypothetical protein
MQRHIELISSDIPDKIMELRLILSGCPVTDASLEKLRYDLYHLYMSGNWSTCYDLITGTISLAAALSPKTHSIHVTVLINGIGSSKEVINPNKTFTSGYTSCLKQEIITASYQVAFYNCSRLPSDKLLWLKFTLEQSLAHAYKDIHNEPLDQAKVDALAKGAANLMYVYGRSFSASLDKVEVLLTLTHAKSDNDVEQEVSALAINDSIGS